jgi:hypothetical protein
MLFPLGVGRFKQSLLQLLRRRGVFLTLGIGRDLDDDKKKQNPETSVCNHMSVPFGIEIGSKMAGEPCVLSPGGTTDVVELWQV